MSKEKQGEEVDDFFGDQGSDGSAETERRNREVDALRRIHFNTGIREGVNDAREAHLQRGFDTGFAAGAQATAEPGFLLGACALLNAWYAKNGCDSHSSARIQRVGDSEIPTCDLRHVRDSALQLRQDLQNIPVNGSVDATQAAEACRKVSVLEIPKYETYRPEQTSEPLPPNHSHI